MTITITIEYMSVKNYRALSEWFSTYEMIHNPWPFSSSWLLKGGRVVNFGWGRLPEGVTLLVDRNYNPTGY